MTKRRLQWAIMTPEGKPLLIDGVIAVVDDETGAVSLDQRAREVVAEVLRNDPVPSRSYLVPGIDLAQEVHQLIQDKHEAGISVHSPLPSKKVLRSEASQATTMVSSPYDEMIRAILTAVHSQMQYLRANLTGETRETIDLEDLRHGRLGQALDQLARIATGDEQASSQEYFELVDYLQQFLSTTLSKEDYARFDYMIQTSRSPAIVSGSLSNHRAD